MPEPMMIRTPVDPSDRSTIVSIYNYQIVEKKVSVIPGRFVIPAGTVEKPAVCVVGAAVWNKEIPDHERIAQVIQVPIFSASLAKSIVNNYCQAVLGAAANARPGLFWVSGVKTSEDVLKLHKKELDKAKEMQHQWYLNLVQMADIDWARTNGNPRAVPGSAKVAAEQLKLDKPWMKDFNTIKMGDCPACGSKRATQYPVCANCKTIIDPAAFKALNLQMAG